MKNSHEELVKLARRWLFQKHSIVITELVSAREVPDAFGWGSGLWTTLVECKADRGDFLKDKKKYFRKMPEKGLGNYRYYLCPADIIKEEELPGSWGLLYSSVNCKKVKIVKHAKRQGKSDLTSEIAILTSLVRRIGQDRPIGTSINCYVHETGRTATVSVAVKRDKNIKNQMSLF